MKSIPLTRGHYALVDDQDYFAVSQYKWTLMVPGKPNGRRYAVRFDKHHKIHYMHRELLKDQFTPERNQCDHIDGNGLNNTRENLRVCNRSENIRNRKRLPRFGRTSKYKGVSQRKKSWIARIVAPGGHQIHLGTFGTDVEAALAYDAAAVIYHGEFACLNFPNGAPAAAVA